MYSFRIGSNIIGMVLIKSVRINKEIKPYVIIKYLRLNFLLSIFRNIIFVLCSQVIISISGVISIYSMYAHPYINDKIKLIGKII